MGQLTQQCLLSSTNELMTANDVTTVGVGFSAENVGVDIPTISYDTMVTGQSFWRKSVVI